MTAWTDKVRTREQQRDHARSKAYEYATAADSADEYHDTAATQNRVRAVMWAKVAEALRPDPSTPDNRFGPQ